MNDQSDAQLLRAYAEQRAEPAFAELVRRHVNLVHSAAVRMVCDPHLAQDVTQGVFVALAKQASQLTERPVLAGWLHGTAKNIAAQMIRTNVRRRAREQEAATMTELLAGEPDIQWEQIAPHLDAALSELNELDRDALLLRYFEHKSAREIAQILGLSDEAAQKRVSRAIERLRNFFSKRNVAIGASGLIVLISANAVQAAPLSLVANISATVISTSAVVAAAKTIAMTTLQKTLITVTIAVLAGAGIYEAHQAAELRRQNQILQQQQTALARQIQQLQKDRQSLSNRFTEAGEAKKLSAAQFNELLKLRGKAARLENTVNDPSAVAAAAWMMRAKQLKQRLEESPEAKIPELQLLNEEDWLAAAKAKLDTDADYRRAFSALRNTGEGRVAGQLNAALQKYLQANNKQFPTDVNQLQPYFDLPVDEAILQRWTIMLADAISGLGFGGTMITEKTAVDDIYDKRYGIGVNGYGDVDFLSTEIQPTLVPVYAAYDKASNGQGFTDPSQLLPYATTPEQQTAVQKLIQQRLLNQ